MVAELQGDRFSTGSDEVTSTGESWIEGEEEKIGAELMKVLDSDLAMAVAVNRVPVVDGHTAHVFLDRIRRAPPYDVALAVVVHNAIRGAGGACLANAELCVARGLVGAPAA